MPAIIDWVQFSPADEFWIVASVAILSSLIGLIGGFKFLKKMHRLAGISTSKIRSAAQGYLELNGHGQLMDGPKIIAPLSGTTCTWYSFSIRERRRSGNQSGWAVIKKGRSDELFLLVDETGKCIIDPEGASVVSSVTDTWYGTTPWPQLKMHSDRKFMPTGRYQYTERRMLPGDSLYATGLYQTLGGANVDFDINKGVITLLKEWKYDSDQLLRNHDINSDGEIDIQEWEAVRDLALQQVLNQHRELQSIPPVNVMGKTADMHRPFVLSAIPKNELIKRYNYYSASLLALFFISGLFASWIVKLRLYG